MAPAQGGQLSNISRTTSCGRAVCARATGGARLSADRRGQRGYRLVMPDSVKRKLSWGPARAYGTLPFFIPRVPTSCDPPRVPCSRWEDGRRSINPSVRHRLGPQRRAGASATSRKPIRSRPLQPSVPSEFGGRQIEPFSGPGAQSNRACAANVANVGLNKLCAAEA